MSIEQLTNILVLVMLVEMMVALGLGVKFAELLEVASDGRLVIQGLLANYVIVPAVTVGLLILIRPADPLVSAGLLFLAVCPGAPFAPACVGIAKGNVPAAIGLMVILAGSSALVAPFLLSVLLPWILGDTALKVDTVKIVSTLLVTQLLPLCVGLAVRHWHPNLAEKLNKPASSLSAILGLATIGLILFSQFQSLAEIRFRGWAGMSTLLVATCAVGYLLGRPGASNRRAMALTTSLRNVGVGLVIATASFPSSAAITATLAYGIFEILGSLLLALVWARY